MTTRFTPPPGWPPVPEGWTPPPAWKPDPSWPPAPAGWDFWPAPDSVAVAPAQPPETTNRSPVVAEVAPVAHLTQGVPALPMPASQTKHRWVTPAVAAGTFLLGLLIGAAGGGNGTPSPAPAASRAPVPTVTATMTKTETVDPTQAQTAALDQRSTELDQRSAELDQRTTQLDAREAAITTAEVAFDQSNLQPGSYIVGTDINPGTWKTLGAVSDLCYFGRNSGNDIMWNDVSTAGQAIATVENVPGAIFEFGADCGPMKKVS